MLRVCYLSGALCVELPADELEASSTRSEAPVRCLKELVATRTGISRFRQRLFQEGRPLQDTDPLSPTAEVQLVMLDYQEVEAATSKAFISACERGRSCEVEEMLQLPCDPNVQERRSKRAGLHRAVENGHLEVVRLLLEAQADKDAVAKNGLTALHLACGQAGDQKLVQQLLEAGAAKDQAAQNGYTALHLASCHAHLPVVQELLEAGADKDAEIEGGFRALYLASQRGHLNVVRQLLQARADTHASAHDGRTALHAACENGHLEVLQTLLKAGADKDAAAQSGFTALHLASCNAHLQVVQELLKAGADKDLQAQGGSTALFLGKSTWALASH